MKRRGATQATCVVEVGVSLPRRISGKVILVISGPGRMMYQSLEPEPEGAIFPKRSMPQEDVQLSSRRWCQYGKLAGNKHTRRIVGSLKPFRWNPAGNQSRPVEPDQQPEASLAWWVGDHPCEA